MDQLRIETPRLVLRPFLESDAKGLFAMESDPEVHRYLGNHPLNTMEEAAQIIQHLLRQYRENGIGRWAILDKHTEEFIGWSGLKYETVVRPKTPYYDLGYRLKRSWWGKGIATETAEVFLEYGFRELNLPEVCAGAHVEHLASNKVLQKVGMRQQGTFVFDGEMHNWYRLAREEWGKKG